MSIGIYCITEEALEIIRASLRVAAVRGGVVTEAGRTISDAEFSHVLSDVLRAAPPSRWAARNEPDPHDSRYDCERSELIGGNLSDDEVANAVFMAPDIHTTTIAKDRIRWLSRKLAEKQKTSPASS